MTAGWPSARKHKAAPAPVQLVGGGVGGVGGGEEGGCGGGEEGGVGWRMYSMLTCDACVD